MHKDRSTTASGQGQQENQVTARPPLSRPPIPDVSWDEYEDVSEIAERTGIKYRVLLDHRVRSLLEQDIDPVQFEKDNHNQPLAIYVLIALRFLLDRFPSMTRFRYSAGAGREVGAEKVPVLATFHQNDQHGYFVALSLDVHGTSLNP
ncbi:MAG: hypothetical protein H0T51_11700 [Pirellulales bacterium]|nr:hypothetical protein [Pirellulales bacterium]